jgi:hypothetical protein
MNNRTIKFRAWIRDEYMSYSHTNKGLGYLEFNDDGTTVIGEDDGDQRYENVPLMQFTGLKDKNGVEIYEGDIVKHDSGWIDEIKWGFITDGGPTCGWGFYDYGDRIAVIGNVYENPELADNKE